MMQHATVYLGGTIFSGNATSQPSDAFAVAEGRVIAIGTESDVLRVAGDTAKRVDLEGRFIMPGVVESHAHMLMFGQSVEKVQLRHCESLEQIQQAILEARQADPETKKILGLSWRFDALGAAEPTAAMIDEVIADVPVFLEANDLHSMWVNTAALQVMGITHETPDPVGGEIRRNAEGEPTGFLLESAAIHYVWKYLSETTTDEDRDRFLQNAFDTYLESGVTTAVEMALREPELATFERMIARDGRLPFPVVAHVLILPSGDLEADVDQVARVLQMRDRVSASGNGGTFEIVGVKFILDGVIDACTAAMREPYMNGARPSTVWQRDAAIAVALAANEVGLQLALHAIGDAASELALDMIEACLGEHGEWADRRPRVEHLESATQDTIQRMAKLRLTASMQPVHCDPAILDNWKAVLGEERAESGFLWQVFREAGVPVALGTDAPTAPHEAIDNLYIALTAKSALDSTRDAYHPERVFSPADGLEAMTVVGAQAAGLLDIGCLRPGARANFTVLDTDVLEADPELLREGKVLATFVNGVRLYG